MRFSRLAVLAALVAISLSAAPASAQFTPGFLETMLEDTLGARSHFISLHTADPGTTGASELTGCGYSRVEVGTSGWTTSSDADSGDATNAGAITFPAATSTCTQPTHIGIFTATTGGDFLGRDAITVTAPALGERVRVPASDFDISVPVS